MTLVKTSLLNGIAVAFKLAASLLINKVLAVYIGPSGYAVIGQYQNFLAMTQNLTGSAWNTGITKYTAEFFDDEPRQVLLWKTSGTLALLTSTIGAVALVFFRQDISLWILNDATFSSVFVWTGLAFLPMAFNGILVSIIQGRKEVNAYIAVNIASSILTLIITLLLVHGFGLLGALVGLAINQAASLMVALLVIKNRPWFSWRRLYGSFDAWTIKALAKFSVLTLTSAVCIPLGSMVIRDMIIDQHGSRAAGQWDALTKMSGIYLMMVTTPLAVYYLPRISEIRRRGELYREMVQGYCFILPLAAASALTVYWLRDSIVRILFTKEFSPLVDLMGWQLMGDVVKIASWLLGYVLVGRAMVKEYVVTEVGFTILLVGLSYVFTRNFGLSGPQMAYFVSYLIHFTVMAGLVHVKTKELSL